MNIQSRIYKFSEPKQEIQKRISALPENSNLTGRWMNENKFIVRNKKSIGLISLLGNIDETEEKGKLKIQVTADYKYLLLYMLPVGFTFFGIWKIFKDLEKGALFIFAGISLVILVFAFTSAVVHNLKREFKESFN